MTDDNIIDFQPSIVTMYRELGQIEGRVHALEETARDIKTMLLNIAGQITGLQTTLSSSLGRRDGAEKAYNWVERIFTIIIAAGTAYIMTKFGR